MTQAEMVLALQKAGYKVTEPEPEPEPDRCHICNITEEQAWNTYGTPLTDFAFVIADCEEGYSHRKGFLCEEHLMDFVDCLKDAGMAMHVHGTICFLEDHNCPGAGDGECPTPERQYDE